MQLSTFLNPKTNNLTRTFSQKHVCSLHHVYLISLSVIRYLFVMHKSLQMFVLYGAKFQRTSRERSQELAKQKCREPNKVENTFNTENVSIKCPTAHKMTLREFRSIKRSTVMVRSSVVG